MKNRLPSSKESINLIYIAGTGRSGSTLLDRMLGQFSGFESLGEVRFLWERGLVGEYLCGCGSKVTECEFWSSALQKIRANEEFDPQLIAQRAHRLGLHKTTKWGMAFKHADNDEAEIHRDLLSQLYRGLRDVSSATWLVDSSKAVAYAQLLTTLPEIRLHIVHLIRDPRAYTHSLRKKIRDEGSGDMFMTNVSAIHASLDWLYVNLGIRSLRNRSIKYMVVLYEDLIYQPEREINRIFKTIGYEGTAQDIFTQSDQVRLEATHTASGNPSRLQSGIIELRIDDAWKKLLPPKDTFIASATLPFYWMFANQIK